MEDKKHRVASSAFEELLHVYVLKRSDAEGLKRILMDSNYTRGISQLLRRAALNK